MWGLTDNRCFACPSSVLQCSPTHCDSNHLVTIMSEPNLLTLPTEIIFQIFKQLNRPSKLSLGLTCPRMLALFASFFDMDRYRNDPDAQKKLGFPADISWDDPQGQAAIIRYLTLSGWDGINSEPSSPTIEASFPISIVEAKNISSLPWFSWGDEEKVVIPPYTDSKEVREDAMIVSIVSNWLKTRFGIDGGCILCVECGRYILCRGPDMKMVPWTEKQSSRPQ